MSDTTATPSESPRSETARDSTPVWITGAHGFIGRHLAQAFSTAGRPVLGIGHGAWPALEAAAWGVRHWLNGDIGSSNLTNLRSLGGAPDIVVHLAGGSSVGSAVAQPREDFHRTVVSTMELFEWLRQESPETRVVVASTAAVYGSNREGPIGEDSVPRPYSPYGFHKLMMESVCESYGATYGIRSFAARLFSVYGGGLKKQLLWDLCSKLSADSSSVQLGGNGNELRDWVAVEDVADILSHMAPLATTATPKCNVGTGVGIAVRDIAQAVIGAWNERRGGATRLSFSGASRPGDPFSLVASPARLLQLGFRCDVDVQAGIARYVDWFQRAHGPAPSRDLST